MIVSVALYREGLEDGFEFHSLSGAFIQYIPKEDMRSGYPKSLRTPIIQTSEGRKPVNEGDCIITDEQGHRDVCKLDGFQQDIKSLNIKCVLCSSNC
ncbi:hypothetical protein ACIFOE_23400 [Paenibacillus sp. NRS-1783]|uniref:hypothetical protein n=1 Tax=Paenibacillus sp. NRS-1783 TaxID=3233907 RepID=UPI003D2B0120